MRFIKIFLVCILLCSCSLSTNQSLDSIFNNTSPSNARVNNYSTYVDYYEPSDIYEVDADETSVIFELNDSKIIMNINIAGIINNRYYNDEVLKDEGFFDNNKLVYNKESYYLDEESNQIPFFFNMYDYEDIYLMHLSNCFINIYGYCNKKDSELMASKIYNLLKSCDVDTAGVLANYSSRDVIEYHKSTVNLFETVMPVEGRIDDMMIEEKETVSQN